MTRKFNRIGPFYLYLTTIVLLFSSLTTFYETRKISSMYQGAWEIYNFYENICDQAVVCIPTNETRYTAYNEHLCEHVKCQVDEDRIGGTTFDKAWDPPRFFRANRSKILFSSSSLNILCFLFLGLVMMGNPTAQTSYLVDTIYIVFIGFSHVCLLYNVSFVISEDGKFQYNVEFIGFIFSLISFTVILFILRRSRRYLGTYTTQQINKHFQRTIQLFASSLGPVLFLFLDGKNCGVGGVEENISSACARLASTNFAVLANIVLGCIFYLLFNFTFTELKVRCSESRNVEVRRRVLGTAMRSFDAIFRCI